MNMKIFHDGDKPLLEKRINEWLKKERINQIRHITHANYEEIVYITVWWDSLDSDKSM
jgi:hypothetical protein